jgi:hypothetical protein
MSLIPDMLLSTDMLLISYVINYDMLLIIDMLLITDIINSRYVINYDVINYRYVINP